MAATLRALIADLTPGRPAAGRHAGGGAVPGAVPAVTLALFLLPIGLGLAGTWAPAFGVLPALGGTTPGLHPWRALLAEPGLPGAVRLTLTTGIGATVLALALSLGVLAAWGQSRAMTAIRRLLAPLLAAPHAAFAIGLAFLIAPSGWVFRAASPWATGAVVPPDLLLVNDPAGIALMLGLAIRETPFLLLMSLAALGQIRVRETMAVARTAGYGPVAAWTKTVLPQLYPQIRLPVFAVLAYSLSVVDMALILGPSTPPPLAPLVLRWFNDPDLSRRFVAAAGATLQLALVGGAIGLWYGTERAVALLARPALVSGRRGGPGRALRRAVGGAFALLLAAAFASLAALAVWSVAAVWRFPDALPSSWTLANWRDGLPVLARPALVSLGAGLASAGLALVLTIGCLEHEQRAGTRPTGRALWLLYLPLLVPQIAFLFGVQVLLVALRLDGTWPALVWSHLIFVLPYVFLALADPWRALDPRYARSAACLGASPARILLRVKLPMLLRPVLFAAATGFSVSIAQYLPSLFAGAGRLPTLTTETVGLALGGDRRIAGVYAFAQLGLPLIGFALALAVPSALFRRRRGLHP